MTTNHKTLSAVILSLFYSLTTLLAETYTQDFNGFNNGTVDLNDGSVESVSRLRSATGNKGEEEIEKGPANRLHPGPYVRYRWSHSYDQARSPLRVLRCASSFARAGRLLTSGDDGESGH